jgi:DNA polymerase I-like protein with 3'-5' exonuclease and polymerase domains/uracil-DNA glycosylase
MTRPVGPCPAKIMLVGEFPGEQEVLKGEPFVGYAGGELNNMLRDAGIMRNTCFVTNVIRTRPPGNDIGNFIAEKKSDITPAHISVQGKMVLPVVRDGLTLLTREIEQCRPNVIIAFGNVSLWALTGKWGITSWRGSVLECNLGLALDYKPKVIPVYHPSVILRNWAWRPIAVHDLKRAKTQSNFPAIIRPEYQFVIRPSFGQAVAVLQQLIAEADKRAGGPKLKLSLDLETRAGHIACVGIAWSKLHAICIPLMCVERPEGYWPLEEEVHLYLLMKRLFLHAAVEGVGQNFIYDEQYFYRWFLFMPNLARDTMLAQHSMFSNMQKGLDFLSSMYCEHHEYWKDEGKEWDPKKHDEDSYWAYNCKDAVITFEVDESERQAINTLAASGWKKLPEVEAFQQKLFWPVLESMNRGCRVDTKTRAKFAMELFDEITKREQWLLDVFGFPVNIKSPLQMKALFYEVLKQKPIISRKTGTVTCDDEAMNKMAEREPLLRPIVRKISELRSLGVFLSTFVNAPLDVDGRLRCSYNIAGTETYRFASKKNAFDTGLNMQNIPAGHESDDPDALDLPNVRKLWLPDEGKEYFDTDLDSADLRIVAAEAELEEMFAMLNEGKKVYVEVMKEYHKDPTMTKHHEQYRVFKGLCHGTHYLGTAKGLAERLGLGVHEVDVIQKWYYGKFPKLKKWQDAIKDQVMKRRMVENVFGYRCYFFDRIEGTIFNQAIAWIPQSTVACIINRAYVNLHENHKDIEVLLQVHDSLAGQYDIANREQAIATIRKAAAIELPYAKPIVVPVDVNTSPISWGHCK